MTTKTDTNIAYHQQGNDLLTEANRQIIYTKNFWRRRASSRIIARNVLRKALPLQMMKEKKELTAIIEREGDRVDQSFEKWLSRISDKQKQK